MVKKKPSGPKKPPRATTPSPSTVLPGPSTSAATTLGSIKRAAAAAAAATDSRAAREDEGAQLAAQQRVLDAFAAAFGGARADGEAFAATLQRVKQALYERDFDAAFAGGPARRREVYAARWSPPRALAYARLLRRVHAHLAPLFADEHGAEGERGPEGETSGGAAQGDAAATPTIGEALPHAADVTQEDRASAPARTLRVLAIGGGAAEIAALAAYLAAGDDSAAAVDVTLLDAGPWDAVVQALHAALTAPHGPVVAPASRLRAVFVQRDALELGRAELGALLAPAGRQRPRPVLVTLLFALNELYASAGGVRRTTALLRALGAAAPPGSLLLVADSPGSYAETAVGPAARRYPMRWLLDHTLLRRGGGGDAGGGEAAGEGVGEGEEEGADDDDDDEDHSSCAWDKLESHDSVWFRLHEKLRYPIALEDMRYQMHLYRVSHHHHRRRRGGGDATTISEVLSPK
ncbi:hypothetical protein GGS23DRAFT_614064 [Durotheca rogersii]|uniref:uncharacterized protein n=1 Tax=Durotheca rogersii TaxID=419775 RepID=UPI00221F1D03|nr:uncharacterized protein GGS23DRAFT_614064 [Durotheca rogersii]KAI5860211.1 hypothetical protein GGS23DRAFT_614064 [Durotheca rogersii]